MFGDPKLRTVGPRLWLALAVLVASSAAVHAEDEQGVKLSAVLARGGQAVESNIGFSVYQGKKRVAASTISAQPLFKVAVGKYQVYAQHGKAAASGEAEVTAGKVTEVTLVLSAGYLEMSSVLTRGGKPVEGNLGYSVFTAEKDVKGQRRRIDAATIVSQPKFPLPAGKYYVAAQHGKAFADAEVEVKAGDTTTQVLVLNAGYLKLSSVLKQGGEPIKNFMGYSVFTAKKDLEGNRRRIDSTSITAQPIFTLPAGKYYVVSAHGNAYANGELTVTAGQMAEHKFVLNAGYLKLSGVLTEGGKPVTRGVSYSVYTSKTDQEGNRRLIASTSISAQPLFRLPAGKYYVTSQHGKASAYAEVEVKAGEATEHALNFNAGYVRLGAVGPDGGPFLSKDVTYTVQTANAIPVTRSTAARPLIRLPAGQYVVTARQGNATSSAKLEVAAGNLHEHVLILK